MHVLLVLVVLRVCHGGQRARCSFPRDLAALLSAAHPLKSAMRDGSWLRRQGDRKGQVLAVSVSGARWLRANTVFGGGARAVANEHREVAGARTAANRRRREQSDTPSAFDNHHLLVARPSPRSISLVATLSPTHCCRGAVEASAPFIPC